MAWELALLCFASGEAVDLHDLTYQELAKQPIALCDAQPLNACSPCYVSGKFEFSLPEELRDPGSGVFLAPFLAMHWQLQDAAGGTISPVTDDGIPRAWYGSESEAGIIELEEFNEQTGLGSAKLSMAIGMNLDQGMTPGLATTATTVLIEIGLSNELCLDAAGNPLGSRWSAVESVVTYAPSAAVGLLSYEWTSGQALRGFAFLAEEPQTVQSYRIAPAIANYGFVSPSDFTLGPGYGRLMEFTYYPLRIAEHALRLTRVTSGPAVVLATSPKVSVRESKFPGRGAVETITPEMLEEMQGSGVLTDGLLNLQEECVPARCESTFVVISNCGECVYNLEGGDYPECDTAIGPRVVPARCRVYFELYPDDWKICVWNQEQQPVTGDNYHYVGTIEQDCFTWSFGDILGFEFTKERACCKYERDVGEGTTLAKQCSTEVSMEFPR